MEAYRPPVGCISVGNISWGGTGKTPVCLWLLNWFIERGLLPLLLTRGYGGKASSYPLILSPSLSPYICGDEPCMLLEEVPLAKIIVDPCRERGLECGWRLFKPDIIILDDGFQYRRLHRDIDIVVFSPSDLIDEWNRLIPQGSWREKSPSLFRAHCFLLNCTEIEIERLWPFVEKRLYPYKKPIFPFEIVASEIIEIHCGEAYPIGEPYMLVAGIGNPSKVEKTATDFLRYSPVDFLSYPDHYPYTLSDWRRIYSRASSLGAKIICTPKDAIKIRHLTSSECYTFKLDVKWSKEYFFSQENFSNWLLGKSIFKYKSPHGDIGDQTNK